MSDMNKALGNSVAIGLLLLAATLAQAESNDSLDVLTNAEMQVEMKLEQFAKANADYQLLLEAQKISSSLNPRGDSTNLSRLDEGCLRLQLKVLLVLANARDSHYDSNASTNRVYLNLIPPLPDSNGVMWPSGVDLNAIKDPKARKAYEDAISENNRRNEKLKREMALSRGEEYALMDIWIFVKHGFPENSAAQKSAIEIVEKTVSDETILNRFKSDSMPGLTW
jgi:hypothetical protein